MTSSIDRLLVSPHFDSNIFVHRLLPLLGDQEKTNLVSAALLYTGKNRAAVMEVCKSLTDHQISIISPSYNACLTLCSAARGENHYLLSRLVHSQLSLVSGFDALGIAFRHFAMVGDEKGMEIILQSHRKYELDRNDLAYALIRASQSGHIKIVQRLFAPDITKKSERGIFLAINEAHCSKNRQAVLDLLINQIPPNKRRKILTDAAIVAAESGNTRCLKYIVQTNLLLPEDLDQVFLEANSSSVDFLLDPNLNLPISPKSLIDRLDQAEKLNEWPTVARILSSKQAISQIGLPKLAYISEKKEFFYILDKHIDKYAEKLDFKKDSTVHRYVHIMDQAYNFGCFRTIKAFVERPTLINQVVVNDLLEATYLIKTEKLTACSILCREAGKEDLAEQIESIINERNRCTNKTLYLVKTKILSSIA